MEPLGYDEGSGTDADRDDVALDRPRSGRTALIASGVIAVFVAVLVAVLAAGDPATQRQTESPLLGRLAPAVQGTPLDGGPYALDDLTGRWVVVNFFATCCPPCVVEHPELVAFDGYHNQIGTAPLATHTQ